MDRIPEPGDRHRIAIIGAGMAGCEAAMRIARGGIPVDLYEMKPKKFSPAHKSEGLGELVCSNSLGSDEEATAPGLLKEEMRQLGSLILEAAKASKIPAGRALGVDRDKFSEFITKAIHSEKNIRLMREECKEIPDYDLVIVATGPLTSDALAEDLAKRIGASTLYFYDSISPIVSADTIDYSQTFFGSRYEPGDQDYLNCPMDRELYEKFVEQIALAEKVPVRTFEAIRCFEACLPIEVLVERGRETLAFGPMKPVGLVDPKTERRPHAVVQLRRENDPTTLYNLVGFQSRMKWGEQKRIFQMIPGLQNAEFVRFGSMHRNTYIDSPRVLNKDLSLKNDSHVFIAGQLTGVEGYVESAAMGQWAGEVALSRIKQEPLRHPPRETAFGALLHAITSLPLHGAFSPMNINFGLFPSIEQISGAKDVRRKEIVRRARVAFATWQATIDLVCPAPSRSSSASLNI